MYSARLSSTMFCIALLSGLAPYDLSIPFSATSFFTDFSIFNSIPCSFILLSTSFSIKSIILSILGFRDAINKIYKRTGLPVFPIENGIGVQEEWDGEHEIQDDYRIAYHREHIKEMFNAMHEDGIPVLGYLGWGLIDILSSQGDMRKRYGVVDVNRTNHDLRDMKRVPKKSYHWLKKVIECYGEEM